MNYTYKLMRQTDGTLLVTIQPLMNDIQKSIDGLMDIDISTLSSEDKQIFDLKILGLKTVYEFLGSLVQEQLLRDKQLEISRGNLFIQTGPTPTIN